LLESFNMKCLSLVATLFAATALMLGALMSAHARGPALRPEQIDAYYLGKTFSASIS
jgi:hypothetical protein